MSDLPLTRPEHALVMITRGERDALREVARAARQAQACGRLCSGCDFAVRTALRKLEEVDRG